MRPAAVLRAALPFALLAAIACANAGSSGDDDDVVGVDASSGRPDADQRGAADAAPGPADAAPGPVDAAPGPVDAAPGPVDAAPGSDGGVLGVCDEAALLPDNDLCADAIDLTGAAAMAGGVTTYGDTRGYTNAAQPPDTCTDGFGQDGPDAIYRIDAAAGDTISVTMSPEGYDGSIYILTDCADATTCQLGTDAELSGTPETLSYPVTADAPYFLVVDSYLPSEAGCYTLHVELL